MSRVNYNPQMFLYYTSRFSKNIYPIISLRMHEQRNGLARQIIEDAIKFTTRARFTVHIRSIDILRVVENI